MSVEFYRRYGWWWWHGMDYIEVWYPSCGFLGYTATPPVCPPQAEFDYR